MSTEIHTETPTTSAESVQTQAPAKSHNRLARIALAGALLSQIVFIVSALVEYHVSLILGPASAVLALVSLVMGFISLRSRPRNLSVAAIVFSGVIVLIFIILLIGYLFVRDLASTPQA